MLLCLVVVLLCCLHSVVLTFSKENWRMKVGVEQLLSHGSHLVICLPMPPIEFLPLNHVRVDRFTRFILAGAVTVGFRCCVFSFPFPFLGFSHSQCFASSLFLPGTSPEFIPRICSRGRFGAVFCRFAVLLWFFHHCLWMDVVFGVFSDVNFLSHKSRCGDSNFWILFLHADRPGNVGLAIFSFSTTVWR